MHIISGIHKNRKLFVPEGIRPSQNILRQQLFSIIGPEIENADVLDLFAGSGAVGLEALSRRAKTATFVEKSSLHVQLLKKNISLLKEEEHCNTFCMDVFKALPFFIKKSLQFDLIFADPPYGDKDHSLSFLLLNWIDQNPKILKDNGTLFLEDAVIASYTPELFSLKLIKERKRGLYSLREFHLRK